ncbi:MAG TPA: UDP-N-acetylmuramoyl-L-alanine--D-glutamate ligase [bacterium]|nr:UDP-N-acetylmuramoyl-L-alanine--D-glutamate ligase [bacterium]
MKTKEFKNKKILILGFGREGQSSLRYLRKYYPEKSLGVADQNSLVQFGPKERSWLSKDKNLILNLGKNYLKNLEKFDVIIKTSGIKLPDQKVKKLSRQGIIVTTNLNIFLANIKGRVIGVTGTKGKSTTASLLYTILKTAREKAVLVGNIGKPFLDYINQDSKQTIFVAELSSYQLDTLSEKLDTVVVASFYPEHLNYHGSLAKYFQAKMNIIRGLKPGGVAVYNQNFQRVSDFIKKQSANQRIKAIGYAELPKELASGARLLGEHNQQNMAGAVAVAKYWKIKDADVKKALAKFQPLEHRLELVGKFKGITFYNDVLSTTPESTIEAIKTLKTKNLQTLIVGGFDRGLNYTKLAREIKKSKIRTTICWPHAGETVARELKKIKANNKIVRVKNMRETIEAAFKHTKSGEAVALSPAASSYDFYTDYREKGAEYKKLIRLVFSRRSSSDLTRLLF